MRKFSLGAVALALFTGLLLGLVVGIALPGPSTQQANTPAPPPQQEAVQPTPDKTEIPAITPAPTPQQDTTQGSVKTAVRTAHKSGVTVLCYERNMGRETPVSMGSGFVYHADGYIATNYHVVDGAQILRVRFYDGKEYDATVVGGDETFDVALLKIDCTDRVAMETAMLANVEVGDQVVAMGTPAEEAFEGTFTVGYVSALRKYEQNGVIQQFIQTDAALNPGNSGGPLMNLQGQVIGINTLKVPLSGYSLGTSYADGIGLAVPMDVAVPILEELRTQGEIKRPGLGISGAMLSQADADMLQVPVGVYVTDVAKDGPCHKAGIQIYDVVTAIDGLEITSFSDMKAYVLNKQIGDVVTLTVHREGETLEVEVTLGVLGSMQYEE